jgi:FkbM family methyltransferase
MSTTARRYWLKLLRGIGVKHFRARSGIGIPYICHLGDFSGEVPFYDRNHSAAEILLMAQWCRQVEKPVVFDIGANNGFIATQLAQLLRETSPRIFAFEPVPSTFSSMSRSVRALGLQQLVFPMCCAISDTAGVSTIAYNPRESLFAQVGKDTSNTRVGSDLAYCATLRLDDVVSCLGVSPTLIKIDVEGSELQVLRGIGILLDGPDAPAICLEWNPVTMKERGSSLTELAELLDARACYYVDDFEGQRMPFGQKIENLTEVDWVCNIFAISVTQSSNTKWVTALAQLREMPPFTR